MYFRSILNSVLFSFMILGCGNAQATVLKFSQLDSSMPLYGTYNFDSQSLTVSDWNVSFNKGIADLMGQSDAQIAYFDSYGGFNYLVSRSLGVPKPSQQFAYASNIITPPYNYETQLWSLKTWDYGSFNNNLIEYQRTLFTGVDVATLVSSVPEPNEFLLMLVGLGFLGYSVRQKSKY